MQQVFKIGDLVYSVDGYLGSYVAPCEEGHIVAQVYAGEDGEDHYGQPEKWQEVFLNAPIARRDERLTQLQNQISDAQKTLDLILESTRLAKAESARILISCSRHKQLSRLENYLDGKFHYFLYDEWQKPRIVSKEDSLRYDEDGRGQKLKLLTLFGDAKGNLQWEINAYPGGGGSWSYVHPCETLQEANALAQSLFDEQADQWRKSVKSKGQGHKALEWAKSGMFLVPDDVAEFNYQRDLERAEYVVADRQKNLDAALAALALVKK